MEKGQAEPDTQMHAAPAGFASRTCAKTKYTKLEMKACLAFPVSSASSQRCDLLATGTTSTLLCHKSTRHY